MLTASPQPIPTVIHQHAEEAAHLRHVRSVLVAAPHVKLHQLRRLDDRIAAHLDGLAVAGEYGTGICEAAIETPGVGEVFAAAVRAIEDKDERRLDKLFALVGAVPDARPGLVSAFGWVSGAYLRGTAAMLLASGDAFKRQVGIAACAMHGVDPGDALVQAIADAEPGLRARALRAAGELGRHDLLAVCMAALSDADAACRFWAAWSSVLLGDRSKAVSVLGSHVLAPNPFRNRALRLVLKVLDPATAQQVLGFEARDPANKRVLIQGAGIAGDGQYLPWLIGQMADDKFARLAGESFSMITGLDLAYLGLERKPPENVEAGPTENPDDENVEMDPDDSLPWPDAAKIQAWWQTNQTRFQSGMRYFMGEPPSVPRCRKVLREGFQRQRVAAAEYLCLLQPGAPLFNTAAPAWRQQRWLAKVE